METKSGAVVLFSGGQDSTTCLLWALRRFERVHPLVVRYGQRHAVEVECARNIARILSLELTEAVCDELRLFSDDALTRSDIPILEGPEKPNTFVPGRN
ncbi:MAG: 7-cyano-7-deazaguanine synthase, partial [Bacteroidia bacterium]|nr:7-cyano-7-deazaguanine synthase [Bacteroidia bacterium]